ncbi:MAG: hypothetical protein ACD_19C00431G0012 [uncultured bacterium]|nr:MAG: hypothetical protein ACD_19C00431G0012 [uncultured bacterium]
MKNNIFELKSDYCGQSAGKIEYMKDRPIPKSILQEVITEKFEEYSAPENYDIRASGRELAVKKVLTEIVLKIAEKTGIVIIIPEK